ncbi:MAG: hypothetical protein U9P72_08075 [Campylobacterota bacterium]|nr:hypothetical protein [Campylobacterota bacterium]
MLLFGHRFIDSPSFYHIQDIQAIHNTPPSSTIFIEFSEENLDIIEHLNFNEINFAIGVKNVTEVIYASVLNASFIIIQKKLSSTIQNIANNYLFDSKILVHIEDEKEIAEIAILGVDGVIFPNAIIKITT